MVIDVHELGNGCSKRSHATGRLELVQEFGPEASWSLHIALFLAQTVGLPEKSMSPQIQSIGTPQDGLILDFGQHFEQPLIFLQD